MGVTLLPEYKKMEVLIMEKEEQENVVTQSTEEKTEKIEETVTRNCEQNRGEERKDIYSRGSKCNTCKRKE